VLCREAPTAPADQTLRGTRRGKGQHDEHISDSRKICTTCARSVLEGELIGRIYAGIGCAANTQLQSADALALLAPARPAAFTCSPAKFRR
jgi:hypothetical protein